MVRSLRPLTHSLRALKSPAEVALMKEAGRITAQVSHLTHAMSEALSTVPVNPLHPLFQAFKKTMGMSQGDIDESLLYAKVSYRSLDTLKLWCVVIENMV